VIDLKERDLSKKKSSLRENIEAITLAIILALFIRTFVVQAERDASCWRSYTGK